MGQLLPRSRDRPGQPATRPSRHCQLCSDRGTAGFAGLHAAAARQSGHWRAFLFRHALSRAAFIGRIFAARNDQTMPSAKRLALSVRRDDARRTGGHPVDRTVYHADREERVPCCLFRFLPRHRSCIGASRCRDHAAFNRAVREAVRRINADKKAYMHYFIDYHAKKDPEIATLNVADLRESRLVVCDPAPIPADEMQRTYDWLKSWGMLERTASPLTLVDMNVQNHAHQAAE